MCFSPTASFVAGAALMGGGSLTLRSSFDSSKRYIAGIPFIFGIHQVMEGVVWLGQTWELPGPVYQGALLGYTAVAFLFWPVYIPWAFWQAEQNIKSKKGLLFFGVLGLASSLFCAFQWFANGLTLSVFESCLQYRLAAHDNHWSIVPYALAALGPFFVSSLKWSKLAGYISTVAFGIAAIFYLGSFSSVWCFFAAVASVGLLPLLRAK